MTIERLVYNADVLALQETLLGNSRELKVTGFETFYNSGHLWQVIHVWINLGARMIDTSRWNNNGLQLQPLEIQKVNHPFVLVNVYA